MNNSSKSSRQRTASSEECCFANEQKTTVNKNSSDTFISFPLSLFVALDTLMFGTPVGCNYTTHSFTLQIPAATNLGFTHPPLLCTLKKNDGLSDDSILHPPTSIAILRSSLIWLPDKYGPEQQQSFAFKGCSSHMAHACDSLSGTFAFWMPKKNTQTPSKKKKKRKSSTFFRGNQEATFLWKCVLQFLGIIRNDMPD